MFQPQSDYKELALYQKHHCHFFSYSVDSPLYTIHQMHHHLDSVEKNFESIFDQFETTEYPSPFQWAVVLSSPLIRTLVKRGKECLEKSHQSYLSEGKVRLIRLNQGWHTPDGQLMKLILSCLYQGGEKPFHESLETYFTLFPWMIGEVHRFCFCLLYPFEIERWITFGHSFGDLCRWGEDYQRVLLRKQMYDTLWPFFKHAYEDSST